jgi:hypothetical protein
LLLLGLDNTLDVFIDLILLDVFVHLNVLFSELDDFFVIVSVDAISMNAAIYLLFHLVDFVFSLSDVVLQTF